MNRRLSEIQQSNCTFVSLRQLLFSQYFLQLDLLEKQAVPVHALESFSRQLCYQGFFQHPCIVYMALTAPLVPVF